MANPRRRLGVVLFQLGGPDTPQAIEPFLFNLFCDPDIIDFPFARIGRKPLAKLISTTRAKKVLHHYSAIGGASPIRRFTEQQAGALQTRLRGDGIDAHCFVAMRYWRCFREEIPVQAIEPFYRHPLYLDALVEKIDEALAQFPESGRPEIVFSAHSVPVSVIEKGDPYQRQIEETVELVMQRGGWPYRHRLCYQSKVGASKWLQPSLHHTIRDLASEKIREVCVVPIAFVSDHVETLGEIDHEAREEAAGLGIQQFEMTSGLNDSPTFIAALADLVANAIGAGSDQARDAERLVAAD